MANYTTRVYDILNSLNDNKVSGYSIEEVINNHWQDIFDLNIWDTYDPNYKKTLCCKILRHYLMYEIGSETVGLWKFNLNSNLSEIMDKYNVMYKNIDKAYGDFFKDVDYSETFNKTESEDSETTQEATTTNKETSNTTANASQQGNSESNGTSTSKDTQKSSDSSTSTSSATNGGTNTGDSDSWQASSDTPQGGLTGLENNAYLSSAVHTYGKTETKNSSEANTESEGTTTSDATVDKTASSTNTQTNTASTQTTSDTTTNNNGTSQQSGNGERNLTENYVKTVIGKMGSENNAKLFNDICSNIANIDMMIIKELKDNFILLWE